MRSWGKRATRRTVEAALVAVAVAACGGPRAPIVEPVGATTSARPMPVDYAFESLDERPVTSGTMRGRVTVLAFVSSFDLESQAEVDFLAAMAKSDGDRANYAAIALEARENRELVQEFMAFFTKKFGVSLRAAMGDAATIAGGGPLGDVHVVPTVVVLDREGRVVWLRTGLSKSEEIRAAMRGL